MAATEPVTPRMSRAMVGNTSPLYDLPVTVATSLSLDGERFHRLVDGLGQVVPELAPQVMTLSRREQEPVSGALGQRRRDHFQIGADQSREVFEGVGKLQGL